MMRNSRPAHRPGRDQAGASYIEVLVTFLLLALVMGALIPLLTSGQQGYDEVRRRQVMIQNARVALDKLLREMRAAESFRTLASGLIQFSMFWGDGTGAAPTVEYSLNGATNQLEYRWKDDWDYRQQITVTASSAVAVDYAVMLTFNHAAMVSAGKSLASGNDVRIRYWNGTKMIELDRLLDPTSGWNLTNTKIWFRLQAAIAAAGTNSNYYLHYGNSSAGSPPANGDNIFLDYEDGTTLDGWTRRDSFNGIYAASASDGFGFTGDINGEYRELSKNVPHTDVEVFWGFWTSSSNNDGHQAGVGARINDSGAGYRVTPSYSGNGKLAIHFPKEWAKDKKLVEVDASTTPGVNYYGRFYLVGTTIRAKYWQVGTAEPASWTACSSPTYCGVSKTDSTYASGNHHSLINGFGPPQDHRQRTVILRPRVVNEPALTLAAESAGARSDPLAILAGPFRTLTVSCFDATGAAIACSPTSAVRAVEVVLVVMDPDGRIPDITLTGRAYRETP